MKPKKLIINLYNVACKSNKERVKIDFTITLKLYEIL